MKTKFLMLMCSLLILFSCTDENDFITDGTANSVAIKSLDEPSVVASYEDAGESPPVPLQAIIVKYYPETSEETKALLREKYDVVGYSRCYCTGADLYEVWEMGPHVQIEPTAKVVKKVEEGDVDLTVPDKSFKIPLISNFSTEGSSTENEFQFSSISNTNFESKIVTVNTGITIAVLDTGIDADLQAFPVPFLHNSSENSQCNEKSGYDFVNGDINPEDNDPSRHGTVVSYVIHNELRARNIPHQILPVKIADESGNSTYSRMLCGFIYAINMNADVINMSFGWTNYDPHAYDMFSQLISNTTATIVTSAGNKDSNNDLYPHYPSNFPQDNLLSVAAANEYFTGAAGYSNYGLNTVDFYAVGNQIQFPIIPTDQVVKYDGTSFACPLVAARVAEIIFSNSPNLRSELRRQFAVSAPYTKPVFYQELIR